MPSRTNREDTLHLPFQRFFLSFKPFFRLKTCDVSVVAHDLLFALLKSPFRRNLAALSRDCDLNYQSIHHFTAYSPWSDALVRSQVLASAQLPPIPGLPRILIGDDTGDPRQGSCAAATDRQYSGRTGKIDTCQVIVLAAYAQGAHHALVGGDFYVPRSWHQDPQRLLHAQIPTDQLASRTKPQIFADLYLQARQSGLPIDVVTADAGYGGSDLIKVMLQQNQPFLLGVKSTQKVQLFPERVPGIPKLRFQSKPLALKSLITRIQPDQWQDCILREGSHGPLRSQIWACPILAPNELDPDRPPWWVVIRKQAGSDGQDVYKCFLSNLPPETSLERFAHIQGQRFWIEKAIRDFNQELGFSQHELRRWPSMQHWLSLMLMASVFLMLERKEGMKTEPLLTISDVRRLLTAMYMPTWDREEREKRAQKQQQERHRQRIASTKSHSVWSATA